MKKGLLAGLVVAAAAVGAGGYYFASHQKGAEAGSLAYVPADTLLFAGGGRLARLGGEIRSGRMRLGMHVLVSGYGGFFGGGLGILLLAYYRLLALSDFKRMTALKLWVSTLIASASVMSFAWGGLVDWRAGGVMIGGTVVGGLLGAKLARFMPPEWLRRGVILTGLVLTATFFHRTYA